MEIGLGKRAGAYILSALIYGVITFIVSLICFLFTENYFLISLIGLIAFVAIYMGLGDVGKKILGIKIVDQNENEVSNKDTLLTTGYASLRLISGVIGLLIALLPLSIALIFSLASSIIGIVYIVLFFMNKPVWRTRANQKLVEAK